MKVRDSSHKSICTYGSLRTGIDGLNGGGMGNHKAANNKVGSFSAGRRLDLKRVSQPQEQPRVSAFMCWNRVKRGGGCICFKIGGSDADPSNSSYFHPRRLLHFCFLTALCSGFDFDMRNMLRMRMLAE